MVLKINFTPASPYAALNFKTYTYLMKIEDLQKLTALERLDQFVQYFETRDSFSPEERKELDRYFMDS